MTAFIVFELDFIVVYMRRVLLDGVKIKALFQSTIKRIKEFEKTAPQPNNRMCIN